MQYVVTKEMTLAFQTREAYKTLRSNIEFSGPDVHSIVLTSCTPNEGKSEVSYELARSFAENNSRVLLLDADLRKSRMQVHFKSGKVYYGLSNYLIGRCTLEECICETDVPNFYVLFSGPATPTPSELLGSERFSTLLKEARKHFDYIVIDTPPLGSVIDAAIIGKQCDGTALVVASGMISYRFAQTVRDQLVTANCKILGCILNKVDLTGGGKYGYYGKYYGRYYGKYYGKYYGSYGNDAEEER